MVDASRATPIFFIMYHHDVPQQLHETHALDLKQTICIIGTDHTIYGRCAWPCTVIAETIIAYVCAYEEGTGGFQTDTTTFVERAFEHFSIDCVAEKPTERWVFPISRVT